MRFKYARPSSFEDNLLFKRIQMRIQINVQSFVDDPDSLRRKRQKLSNSSSSILFKHVADFDKREYTYAKLLYILPSSHSFGIGRHHCYSSGYIICPYICQNSLPFRITFLTIEGMCRV